MPSNPNDSMPLNAQMRALHECAVQTQQSRLPDPQQEGGKDDVCLGHPCHCGKHIESEDAIGRAMNTALLRSVTVVARGKHATDLGQPAAPAKRHVSDAAAQAFRDRASAVHSPWLEQECAKSGVVVVTEQEWASAGNHQLVLDNARLLAELAALRAENDRLRGGGRLHFWCGTVITEECGGIGGGNSERKVSHVLYCAHCGVEKIGDVRDDGCPGIASWLERQLADAQAELARLRRGIKDYGNAYLLLKDCTPEWRR